MDLLSRQELDGLKSDKKLGEESLEAEKFTFQHKLNGEYGRKMMEELNHPKKPSFWVGLKYRYRRWKTIRDNKRMAKRIKKGGF